MSIDDSLRRQGIKILETEQTALDGAFKKQSTEKAPDGLLFDKFEQLDDGTWKKTQYTPSEQFYDESVVDAKENEAKDKADVLRRLCKEVDDKILRLNGEINAKKQLIVDLSTEASNGNCWPGIAYSATPSSSVRLAGTATSTSATNTTVNNDVEFTKIYDKMAGPGFDAGAENPFDPDRIIQITASYSGYGRENKRDNVEFRNTSNVATGSSVDGSGSNIGNGRFDISSTTADHNGPRITATVGVNTAYWYAGVGVAPDASDTSVTAARCVAIASSIDTIYQEIIQIRKSRDSLRGALNKVKKNKSEKELTYWGMINTKTESDRRQTSNAEAILGVTNLDVEEDEIDLPEGLQLELDAANNSSYYGSGTIWYDLTDNNDANIVGGPTFIDDPVSDDRNRFDLDGVNDTVNFRAVNVNAITTPTVTVEVLAKLKIDLNSSDSNGYMIFGWDQYDVWTGPILGDGTPFGLGFNTGAGDVYGLSSTRVNNLGLNNNFIHYVFEMRSDVSYTNNKIYINGSLQSQLEVVRAGSGEDSNQRNFNVSNPGNGRISGWRGDNGYKIPMEISLFRVYNKALTQDEITASYNAVSGRFA